MIGSSTAHNVNTQTLCLMHHEVITSSTPTTIRLVTTDGQMSDTCLGDCRISFLGCLHTAHLFFHTTPHDAILSATLVAVVSSTNGGPLQTLLASSITVFIICLISALAFTRPSGCWLTAHPSIFASTLLLDNTRLQFTLNAPQQHGTSPLHNT